ncbi:hypothetical protein SGPA1_12638 [Streptomyces misionensis JCM 4497]
MDTRRVPGRAHPGDRLHGGGDQGGRVRRAAAAALRRAAGAALGLAAGDVGGGDHHHAGRCDRRDHPDRHQAAAGVLVHRARRVHPRGCHRHLEERCVVGPLLPGRLLVRDHRRVRGGHPGAGRGRRSDPPVQVGRARPAFPAGRGGLRGVPAGLRRHPADVRLRREVRRVQGGGGRRRGPAGGHRCDLLGDRGVLLHPRDRADVLQRAQARGPDRGRAVAADHAGDRHRRGGHAGARCGAAVLPRPGEPGERVRALSRRRTAEGPGSLRSRGLRVPSRGRTAGRPTVSRARPGRGTSPRDSTRRTARWGSSCRARRAASSGPGWSSCGAR